jgi:hypothetical protein
VIEAQLPKELGILFRLPAIGHQPHRDPRTATVVRSIVIFMSRYIVRSLADLPTMGHRSNAPIHGQYV